MGDSKLIPVVYKKPFERNYEGDPRRVTPKEYERIKAYVRRTDKPQGVTAAPTAPTADKAAKADSKQDQREELAGLAGESTEATDTDEGGDPDLLADLLAIDVEDWEGLKAFAREHDVDGEVNLRMRGENLRDAIADALANK